MEANAARACRVGHVLTICGGNVILSSWTQKDPTYVVDDGAAWLAWWRGVVCGGCGAASK